MNLESRIEEVKGIGTSVGAKFRSVGIATVKDLINYYPRRYDDFSELTSISKMPTGSVTVKAKIKQIEGRYVRGGLHITEAIASDDSGSVRLVWFNQPYRKTATKLDQEYFVSGNYELSHQKFAVMNPSLELVSDFPLNTARIIPIYKEAKNLNSRQIRAALGQVLPVIKAVPEILPSKVVAKHKLLRRSEALSALHFPKNSEELAAARFRLGFEEVFALCLASLLNKQENLSQQSVKVVFNQDLAKKFVENLSFKLTDDQRRVTWQIYQDLEKPHPMTRLLEGDVGSGKTVVATMAALMAMEQGLQVALMAPTEILAKQHAETIYKLLKPLNLENRVSLLVGSLSASQKDIVYKQIKAGEARFIIGTQALIQDKVDMHNLALVIIDEQHRFGVEQRQKLLAKAGHMPHLLSLTATPIPRSLALTVYGELDVSVLTKKPTGRKPVTTKLTPESSLPKMYEHIKSELANGRQAFIVCPLITKTDLSEAKSAQEVYEQLKNNQLKDFNIGLIHGKMKSAEQGAVMSDFIAGKIAAIVSTTVIEVGVDVPNATVMVIQNAERFGLAQIHQLRGRVGRGEHQGYCYLLVNSNSPTKRLRAVESSNDGFKLAELDLEIRGPGAIYGNMQHGKLDLRMAKITDTQLISKARQEAQAFLEDPSNLLQYKELQELVGSLRTVTNLN